MDEASVANGKSNDNKTLGQRVDWVNDSAQEAWSKTRSAVDDIKRAADIDGRVKRNPYGTLAAAVGIGYVLGGGIFTPLTSRIVALGLRLGIRMAVLPMLQEEISELADVVSGENGGRTRRSGKSAKSG